MIRYATDTDLHKIAKLVQVLFELPAHTTKTYSLGYIVNNLHNAVHHTAYDLIVSEVHGEVVGCACAALSQSLLYPDLEYREEFIVSSNPLCTRSMIKWIIARGQERGSVRVVIGSTNGDPRYDKLLRVTGMHDYGKTFVKELSYE